MSEKVQINLQAGAEQKARWEAYVEESGRFATLSELIRASVEAELSQQDTDQSEPAPALSNDINQLRDELTAVRKHVAWLREHFQDDVDVAGLAQDVFEALQPLPEVDEPIEIPTDVEMSRDEYHQLHRARAVLEADVATERSPQTAAVLADRLDTSPDRIKDAIAYLDEQFLPVVTIDHEGERHYFREA